MDSELNTNVITNDDLESLVNLVSDSKEISFDENTHELSNDIFTLSLNRTEFEQEKMVVKFVHAVEGIVRKMPEYRDWVSYIKDSLGYFSCAITGEISSQVTIDIHHHPVSLYAITKGVLAQYLNSGKEFNSLTIAKDVIELHYKGKVGYIPLIRSLHEKLHNGFLSIPIDLVKGDWKYVAYNLDHDEKELEIINARAEITKNNCGWGDNYFWTKDDYKGSSSE